VRSVITDWLRPAIEEGDMAEFVERLLAALNKLQEGPFQPDGVTARYAVA